MLHQNPVFCVYILRSQQSGKYYVGHCEDLGSRIDEHNRGKSLSTRAGRPWTLMHTEPFSTRSEAMARERQIKSWKSSKAIRALIEGRASR